MTEKAENRIEKALNEVNGKVISEAKLEARLKGLAEGRKEGLAEGREVGIKEGRKEGIKEGREEGKRDAMKTIAKNLKGKIDIEELSSSTGLSIAEIQKL